MISLFLDKLYWISANKPPQSHSEAYFFNVDNELVYEPFNSDFGPLNIANTHKYIQELCRLLADERYKTVKLQICSCGQHLRNIFSLPSSANPSSEHALNRR